MSVSLAVLFAAMAFAATSVAVITFDVQGWLAHCVRRAELRQRMRGLEGSEARSELGGQPLSLRILYWLVRFSYERPFVALVGPVISRVQSDAWSPPLGRAFAHDTDLSTLLDRADLRKAFSRGDIERSQVVAAILGAILGFLILFALISLFAALIGLVVGMYVGARFPVKAIAKTATRRVDRCITQLPHMIEVISLSSTAGASLANSLDLYCARFEGPLPEEMRKVVAAWKTGAQSWEQALAELAHRLDTVPVTHFVSTITQAIKSGAPMAQMLEAQSAEARRAKRAHIEEQIEKAPVKMLLPMGALVLPAMLLLILGPVLLGMSTGS